MSNGRALAVCHRRRGRHVLAWLEAHDGRATVRYAAAVGGLSLRREKPRGQFNIGQSWAIIDLESEDVHAGTFLYCEACGSEYHVTLSALVSSAKEHDTPVILQPH